MLMSNLTSYSCFKAHLYIYMENMLWKSHYHYPAVRRGSSNTRFFFFIFIFCFFGVHLPQTSGFCLAKQILVASFATQVRACILGGHDIFCTLGEGQQWRGIMPLGLLLLQYFFFRFPTSCCVSHKLNKLIGLQYPRRIYIK